MVSIQCRTRQPRTSFCGSGRCGPIVVALVSCAAPCGNVCGTAPPAPPDAPGTSMGSNNCISIDIEALILSIIINGLPSMIDAYSVHMYIRGFSTHSIQVFALEPSSFALLNIFGYWIVCVPFLSLSSMTYSRIRFLASPS